LTDRLDRRGRPTEHDGATRHRGASPRPERQRKRAKSCELRRGQSESISRSARYPHLEERQKSDQRGNVVGAAPPRNRRGFRARGARARSEEHTSELQSPCNLVCRLLLEKKKRRFNHFPHRVAFTPAA